MVITLTVAVEGILRKDPAQVYNKSGRYMRQGIKYQE